MVKQGFTGVYLICLISAQNIDCGYSLEPLKSTHNLCFEQKYEKISELLTENFHFLGGEIFNVLIGVFSYCLGMIKPYEAA